MKDIHLRHLQRGTDQCYGPHKPLLTTDRHFLLNAPTILIVFPWEPTFDKVTMETSVKMAVAEVRLKSHMQTHFPIYLVMDYAEK